MTVPIAEVIVGSFVGFLGLYFALVRLLPFPDYIKKADQISYHARMVSLFWALIGAMLGFQAAFIDRPGTDISYDSDAASWFIRIEVGYIMYDAVLEYLKLANVDQTEKASSGSGWVHSLTILAHHIMTIVFCAAAINIDGIGTFKIGLLALTAVATVFVHLRWYLIKAGKTKSVAYMAVGVGMLVSWVSFRLYLFPIYCIQMVGWNKGIGFIESLVSMRLGCITGTVIFAGLNLYWFSLMMKIVFDVLCGTNKKSKNEAKQD